MNPKDVGYLAGVAISLVMAGASLKQQSDETDTSSKRITGYKNEADVEIARMRLELDGMKAALGDSKTDRDLLIRMDERLKVIERAVTKKGR